MFYCDECATKREWPESIGRSYGRCEVCGEVRSCNNRASSTLPPSPLKLPDFSKINYERADKFMSLFTKEEKEEWGGNAPNWVFEAVLWFVNRDPGHIELMKRLKDS